jgi:hypothetical protein
MLVLVLGSRTRPYSTLTRVAEATWASVTVDGVSVLFYYGGRRTRRVGSPALFLPVPDDFAHIGEKTIACFQHVLANDIFDLVFRTNCSSYVDLVNLSRYVADHAESKGFYAGVVGRHDAVTFASGSGYFLSRDLVETVVRERDAWNHALLDDVALGLVLAGIGLEPVAAPRVDCMEPAEAADVDTSQFHFRCKTPSWGRIDDIEIMLRIHASFCEARGWSAPRAPLDWRLARASRRTLRFVRHQVSRK